ncbi:hypothetical protein SAMN05444266_10693 [Chitinophaga jiangningensis]|uniref:Uncharacterized protein n=1 Tax=Chitinophaga jiangningensis TaxID=1419482 RepID=A0A1M7FCW3_9BACT|nr:hypothetical protein [Chitinophaga jiangningensis]SHM01924.1 hypothetical protein SAMN05444266_10693 [Chitinophaga jiangningensis]
MSWMDDLYVIYQKLDANSCQEVKKEIIKAQLNGCSDGTIYYLVLQQLVKLKGDKAPVYELIKGEVESIIHAQSAYAY